MNIGLKWVHMARYELILTLDGALWLTIIFQNPLDPKKGHKHQKSTKKTIFWSIWDFYGPSWGQGVFGNDRDP